METKILVDKDKVFRIDVYTYFDELNYRWVEEPEFKYFLGIFKYKNNLVSRFVQNSYSKIDWLDIYLKDIEEDASYHVEGGKLYQTPYIEMYIGNKTITKHFRTIKSLELYLKQFPNCQFNLK